MTSLRKAGSLRLMNKTFNKAINSDMEGTSKNLPYAVSGRIEGP